MPTVSLALHFHDTCLKYSYGFKFGRGLFYIMSPGQVSRNVVQDS